MCPSILREKVTLRSFAIDLKYYHAILLIEVLQLYLKSKCTI